MRRYVDTSWTKLISILYLEVYRVRCVSAIEIYCSNVNIIKINVYEISKLKIFNLIKILKELEIFFS